MRDGIFVVLLIQAMNQIKGIFIILFLFVLVELFYFGRVNLGFFIFGHDEAEGVSNRHKRPDCDPIIRRAREAAAKFGNSTYPMVVPNYRNDSINFTCLNSDSYPRKLILFWTGFWWSETFQYGLGPVRPFKSANCPVWNCETTNDRERLEQTDAVLVHINDFQNNPSKTREFLKQLPPQRPARQRWVYLNFETPATNRLDLAHSLQNIFNLSATYMAKSDFNSIYHGDMKFKWTNKSSGEYDRRIDVFASKIDPAKQAAAFISNCNSPSNRKSFIEALGQIIKVDIYGSCGDKKCPTNVFQSQAKNDCRIHIAENYKFFLALENSLCLEYITEKFFRTVNFDIIPVVYGLGDYSKFIPKSGFIDVKDFKSPKELGDYLNYLSANKTAYNEYFKWKNFIRRDDPASYQASHFHSRVESIENFMCELCTHLQLETYFGIKKSVLDVEALFLDQEHCI